MSRKYELWFLSDDKKFKIMNIEFIDERFKNYVIDSIMYNIDGEIEFYVDGFTHILSDELSYKRSDFKFLEVK